jgi:hypothetical protein
MKVLTDYLGSTLGKLVVNAAIILLISMKFA